MDDTTTEPVPALTEAECKDPRAAYFKARFGFYPWAMEHWYWLERYYEHLYYSQNQGIRSRLVEVHFKDRVTYTQ